MGTMDVAASHGKQRSLDGWAMAMAAQETADDADHHCLRSRNGDTTAQRYHCIDSPIRVVLDPSDTSRYKSVLLQKCMLDMSLSRSSMAM